MGIPPQTRRKEKAANPWSLPWFVFFVALNIFVILFCLNGIVKHYFIRGDWNGLLPGLGTTVLRKFCIGCHMACGCVSLLLGPTQFLSIVRRKFPSLHRWCGLLFLWSALASSLFGLLFIVLKGKLVGGWNMTAAFSVSGITFGATSYMALITARRGDVMRHRAWAIRSYSQILSPVLYRYWYILLAVRQWYSIPASVARNSCHEDGTCDMYLRTFDRIHVWTYWTTALAVAEIIVWALPPFEPPEKKGSLLDELTPLKVEFGSEASQGDQISSCSSSKDAPPSVLLLNLIGVALAVVTAAVTSSIFFV